MSTIDEIARQAGVDPSFVSHVLAGRRPVSEKLRPFLADLQALSPDVRLPYEVAYKEGRAAQSVMRQAFKSVTIDLGPLPKAYIIPLTDMHVGSEYFREDVFLGYRDWIRDDPCAFTMLLGDNHDNNIVGNKASDVYTQTLTPTQQMDRVTELLLPVRSKILAGTPGSHDLRIVKQTSIDLMEQVWKRLAIDPQRYDRNAVLVRVLVGEEPQCEYTIFVVHGWGGARNAGGQVNKLEELAKVVDADIFLAGHEHTLTHSRINYRWLSADGSVQNKRKLFIGCGGFKDYDGFLVSIGRRPPDVGAPRIRLDGTRKDIHVSF